MPISKTAREQKSALPLDAYHEGPLAPFLREQTIFELCDPSQTLPEVGSQAAFFASWLLQDVSDYRGTLQRWFACLRIGGMLIVTVPHSFLFERQDAAPSRRRPGQRRIYTPRSLIEEIEEALTPNCYRIRWLGDLDRGYDYGAAVPAGQAEVGVAIERIDPPAWGLDHSVGMEPAPVNLFEQDHVRIERQSPVSVGRILVLKFDHLGDFVMGLDALYRLRAVFPAAEITLVVGSWNEMLARELGVADHLILFDAFPHNSGEEEPDIAGTRAVFEARVTGHYDLAIDLRTNWDSRFLLRYVQAPVKAGLGLKAHFPFLDIFLPVDAHVDTFDVAWSAEFAPDRFHAQAHCDRSAYSIASNSREPQERSQAVIWGPYQSLTSGEYVFEPYLEIGSNHAGLMLVDVALNTRRVTQMAISEQGPIKLSFANDVEQAQFEFRIYAADGEPLPDFRLYGGRLSRRGNESALHQSEYLMLLVELIALRLARHGMLVEARL